MGTESRPQKVAPSGLLDFHRHIACFLKGGLDFWLSLEIESHLTIPLYHDSKHPASGNPKRVLVRQLSGMTP